MLRHEMELTQMWHTHTTKSTANREKTTDDDRVGIYVPYDGGLRASHGYLWHLYNLVQCL